MESYGGRIGRAVIVLAGVVALLIAYYWVHKPFDFALLFSLGGALLDTIPAVLIVLVTGGVGRAGMDWLLNARVRVESIPLARQSHSLSRPERIALEAMLGLGVLGWAALMLGLIGLYTRVVLWLALVAIAIVCRRSLRGWLADVRQIARSVQRHESRWTLFLALLIGLLLSLAFVQALAAPTAFDALNYHLVIPQRYLHDGRIVTHTDNHFFGFPQGLEILFGAAISLFGRDTAAAPLHFIVGLLGLLAVGGLTRRYANMATGWLAVTLLLSAHSVWLLFGWAYVDLAVMAYGAVGLTAAVQWRETGARGWLVIMGLCSGMALGVKYPAAGLLLALGIYTLISAPKQALTNTLTLGLAALLAFAPWMIKGIALYHNPLYPFIFGGVNWDASRTYTFSTPGPGLLNTSDAWQLLVLPLAATVFGVEKGEGYMFTAGPWLLTAPLLLLLGWRALDERVRLLARDGLRLALPLLAFWLLMALLGSIGAQTRLMAMALPVAAMLGALGLDSLSRWPNKPLDVAFVVRGALVITLLLGAAEALRETVRSKAVPYLLGTISRDDYLNEHLFITMNAMRQLERLPPGSEVRFAFDSLTYYCPSQIVCIPDVVFDHWFRPLRQGKSSDAVFADWKAEGDDYLLFFKLGYDSIHAVDARFKAENALFPEAVQRWMKPIWQDDVGGYILYTWK